MKIKVSKATSTQLDWLVAEADGDLHPKGNVRLLDGKLFSITPGDHETRDFWHSYKPTTNWSQGGPILERECINLFRLDPKTEEDSNFWVAHIDGLYCRYGLTALIAAMRCYVASKLGDEVEVPEELL